MTYRHLWLTTMLVGAVACGGSGDDDGSGSALTGGDAGDSTGGGAAGCAVDEMSITGSLDGEPVSHRGALGGHAWIQASTGATFDASLEGGGSVHLDWDGVVADGQTIAVTGGQVTLPVSGPRSGETLTAAAGSLTKLDDEVRFELTELSASVQCVTDPCPADSVEGTLRGCAHWAPITF